MLFMITNSISWYDIDKYFNEGDGYATNYEFGCHAWFEYMWHSIYEYFRVSLFECLL